MDRKTFVYFIQQGTSGPIKIGHSNDPAVRMAALQTAHSERLRLLFFESGGRQEEAATHERFASCRIGGEWFEPTHELLTYIRTWRMVDAHNEPHLETQWSPL